MSTFRNTEIPTELSGKIAETATKGFVAKASAAIDESNDLLNKALDARGAIDAMATQWQASWLEFIGTTDARIRELRERRMTMDTETRMLMANLREVRTFFLNPEHEKEVARLREFVELCEKLRELKTSGFLDAVADTMLKIS